MILLPTFAFIAPLPLLGAAIVAALRPGFRPGVVPRIAEGAALLTLGLALEIGRAHV